MVGTTVSHLVGSALSRPGRRTRLIILMYHRVLREPDPLLPDLPDARTFDMQMAQLGQAFRPTSLPAAIDLLSSDRLPPRTVCVTFDDGYADNHDVALSILKRHGIPATIFVAPGFLDGGYMWNDGVIETVRSAGDHLDLNDLRLGTYYTRRWEDKQRAVAAILGQLKYRPARERAQRVQEMQKLTGTASPRHLMMSRRQVKALRDAGHVIGAHTMTHPILTQTPDSVTEEELAESKSTLEKLLDESVDIFAYPNGNPDRDYALRHVAAVRAAGFKAAVNVSWGYADSSTDRYQLPRIWPWDRTPRRFTLRLWRTYLSGPGGVASV